MPVARHNSSTVWQMTAPDDLYLNTNDDDQMYIKPQIQILQAFLIKNITALIAQLQKADVG